MNAAQRLMLFKLWNEFWKGCRRQGVAAKENDQRRREATREALGCDRGWNENWSNGEVDKMKAWLLARTKPADMNAQIAQLNQAKKRHVYVIDRICREIGATRDYADAIAAKMNHEGKIGADSIEQLDEKDLSKIIVALKLHAKRAKARKVAKCSVVSAQSDDPDWNV